MDNAEIWYEVEDLMYMKWKDTFCCVKCGINNYRVVNVTGRRCKDCGTEESLFKYTAFERIKVPFDKIQEMLLTIRDATESIIGGHIVVSSRNKKKPDAPRKYIKRSVVDYIDYSLDKEQKRYNKHLRKNEGSVDKTPFKEFDYDSIISRAINKTRPSIRDLAKYINIEENTVSLLLNKINDRIPLDHIEDCKTPYLRIELFFDYMHKSDGYSSLMNLLMLPLVGEWNKGKYKNNEQINITEFRGEWKFGDSEESFEYGDDRWNTYFVKTNEAK